MRDGQVATLERAHSGGGLFLAFEGVEGSGKSTQATRLAEYLRARGTRVVHAREPGSTPLGERVRSLLLDEVGVHVPPLSELFLLLAARAAFVQDVVLPALRENAIVIADRFELSTLAYQGAGRGLPIEVIGEGNRWATGGLSPDLTLLLELPPEEGAHRQRQARKEPDRMEREADAFHLRVARGYADLAHRVEALVRIDARGSIGEVQEEIMAALSTRFPETFPAGTVIS
jgi:dTMP kinase